jgi:hypothetical protein
MNRLFLLIPLIGSMIFTSSCELFDELDPESETEKVTRIFVEGSPWRLDTLNMKTDLYSAGISNVTSDTTLVNAGTIEFLDPAAEKNPGYNAGYMIHRFTENGMQKTDTLAWVPYNFSSFSDNHVTIFIRTPPNLDFVVGAWDMYLDKVIIEEKKIKIEGWRRETIHGGSGGAYGSFRSYVLSR